MGSKQQADIKEFLTDNLEGHAARELFARQSALLRELISNVSGKSAEQAKTLEETIPPPALRSIRRSWDPRFRMSAHASSCART